jgi:CRP-like cAMP-binding protein
LEHVSKRSVRQKIYSYLLEQEFRGGKTFNIPHNKTDLADLLFVDRSSVTRCLSQMKKEGIITLNGRICRILKKL